jgi:hypothetical protein
MRLSLSIVLALSVMSTACVVETSEPEPAGDAGQLQSHPTEAGYQASYCEGHPDVPACSDSATETD